MLSRPLGSLRLSVNNNHYDKTDNLIKTVNDETENVKIIDIITAQGFLTGLI
jgi:hypothetical protein